jgi:hypothetical protein
MKLFAPLAGLYVGLSHDAEDNYLRGLTTRHDT